MNCVRYDDLLWPGSVTEDFRGRLRVCLGKLHPAANSGGWQYIPRYLVWSTVGELPRKDEHVHHRCNNVWCCNVEHLDVSLAEYHGRYHALYTCLRDGRGRFCEVVEPKTYSVPRLGPVIGRSVLSL